MSTLKLIFAAVASLALLMPTIAEAHAPGRITGVGGIFVTSKDPKALTARGRVIDSKK